MEEFLIQLIGWFILIGMINFNRGEDKLITFTSKLGWVAMAILVVAVYLINIKL